MWHRRSILHHNIDGLLNRMVPDQRPLIGTHVKYLIRITDRLTVMQLSAHSS